jgi:hypothetical protein
MTAEAPALPLGGTSAATPAPISIEGLKAKSNEVEARSIPGWFLGPLWVWIVVIVALVILGVEMLVLSQGDLAKPSYTLAGVATFLGLVAAIAVAIERTMEIWWTFVGLIGTNWWPVGPVGKQYKAALDQLDAQLQIVYGSAKAKIDDLSEKAGSAPDNEVQQLQEHLTYLRTQFAALRDTAPQSQQVRLLTDQADRALTFTENLAKTPEVSAAASLAKDAINDIDGFVTSFKDNPRRRLISIYLGAIIGVALAGTLGLDLIHAALGVDPADIGAPYWGTVASGVVIGLGASPTHEVIRLLQEYKKQIKGANATKTSEGDTP